MCHLWLPFCALSFSVVFATVNIGSSLLVIIFFPFFLYSMNCSDKGPVIWSCLTGFRLLFCWAFSSLSQVRPFFMIMNCVWVLYKSPDCSCVQQCDVISDDDNYEQMCYGMLKLIASSKNGEGRLSTYSVRTWKTVNVKGASKDVKDCVEICYINNNANMSFVGEDDYSKHFLWFD